VLLTRSSFLAKKAYGFPLNPSISEAEPDIDLNNVNDWDDLTYNLDLEKGDIICVRFFNESKYGGLATYYTYLDFYVRDEERFDINQETIISKDLIFKNTSLFDNITLKYNRDKKIKNILND
jgi:hypothetical protein